MITMEILTELGACPEQSDIFEEQWPDGAEITIENARKAVRMGIDVQWLVRKCAATDTRAKHWPAVERAYLEYIETTNTLCESAVVNAAYDKWRETLAQASVGVLTEACNDPHSRLYRILHKDDDAYKWAP